MSGDGSGAPGTGNGNGNGGQGGTPPAPTGGQPNNGQSPAPGTQPTGGGNSTPSGGDPSPWDAIQKEFGDPDKVREALGHARKWEQRAKENFEGAQQAQTLEQQLAQFKQQLADRDEKDVQRSAKTALAQLKGELGQAGVKWDDVDEALRPDSMSLLKDGEPDDERISKLVAALTRHAGRPAPDPDQGQKGGKPPADMNAWIRQRAGVQQ